MTHKPVIFMNDEFKIFEKNNIDTKINNSQLWNHMIRVPYIY